ncbi:MAG: Type restriction-modification system, specificity subunit, partial [Gemmataceae bacterium]|nr:Type restriction-modification system, specificity subunit [Gemmataceae bacterium]
MEPKTLSERTLAEVAELLMGNSPPGESYNDNCSGLPLINGPAEYGSRSPIPVKWTTAPTRVCKPGDVLICVRGNTTGRMNIADRRYCIGRGVAAVTPKPGISDPDFLRHILARLSPRILNAASGAGTTFPNINKPQLAALKLPHPPLPEQKAIARVLDAADAAIERTQAAVEAARRVKRGLVQTVLTRGIGADGRVRDPGRHPPDFAATRLGLLPRTWSISTVGAGFDIATGFTSTCGPNGSAGSGPRWNCSGSRVHPPVMDRPAWELADVVRAC